MYVAKLYTQYCTDYGLQNTAAIEIKYTQTFTETTAYRLFTMSALPVFKHTSLGMLVIK